MMEMKNILKDFNKSVQCFEKKGDKNTIIQGLQALSSSDDLSVFDNNSFEGSEMYVGLYELLTHHASDPEIVWNVVKVLATAVHNHSVRTVLVHRYNFIHPLTALLGSQITSEQKSTILNIVQELSYGIVICWQEAHLPQLIGLLVDLVMDEDDQLTPLALGTLANLCHNNKPAIYTLVNYIDVKMFTRKIVNLQRNNIEMSVQVCKMLMVLDQLSGNVPDAEILTFVQVSFIRIKKAFMSGNLLLMRHIVHFFRDAKESKHSRKVLLTYPKYEEEVNSLISALKTKEPDDWQCVQQLVELLQHLVDLELPALVPLFTRLTQCLLSWLRVDRVAPATLDLLSDMLRQCRKMDEQEYENMCSCLESQLQMFIEVLHRYCREDTSKAEVRDLLIGLLHLFHELTDNPQFCSIIASNIDKEQVKNLLLPLMTLDSSNESRLFHHPFTVLCVEVLSFLSELSLDDKEWLFLYSDLLQKKQILKVLSIALYFGSYEVKKQILYLAGTTSFSSECLTGLSKYLTELNQLLLPSSAAPGDQCHEKNLPSPKSQIEFAPLFSKAQSESLNRVIGKLEDLYSKNKIEDASLAEIIELYNYKLTEMRRTECSLRSSVEAADKHRTQLSHQVAQLSAETGRLHQLLYVGQQAVESCHVEAVSLRKQLRTAQECATTSHVKFKQLKQDVHSKGMIIKEQNEEMTKMKSIINEHEKRCEQYKQKTADLEDKIEALHQSIQRLDSEKLELQAVQAQLEEQLKARDETIVEKDIKLEKKSSQVQTLEQEISKQLGLIKGLEKTIKEKDKELVDLERTRKLIFELSGGKKNN